MASTYSDLKIELIGTGEQVGTWGVTTNTNLGTAIEEAITGSATVSFSSADVTLTLTNTNGTQAARNLRLVCSGTSGGARNLILGSGCQINKLYLVQNDLADALTVKNTTGTGVTIPAGRKQFVFNDGTNVVIATTAVIDLTTDVTGTLPIANGGTNATATPTQGGVSYGTGSAYAFTSAGTTNQILKSNGTSAPSWINQSSITAGAATQIDIDATTSSDTSTYPVLVGAASTGNQTPFVDTGLSYNASTNALTATTFVGALTGAASALVTSNDYRVDSFGVGTNASGTTGEIRATNNVTAYYSDERLKTRLGNIEGALEKVSSLSGFYYKANQTAQDLGYESIQEVGVSAQEVQKVLPEIVVPAPIDDKYLTVRYERLAPLFIEAIKELSEKCDNLQAEVNRLKGG